MISHCKVNPFKCHVKRFPDNRSDGLFNLTSCTVASDTKSRTKLWNHATRSERKDRVDYKQLVDRFKLIVAK